jgi:hypothetical protein
VFFIWDRTDYKYPFNTSGITLSTPFARACIARFDDAGIHPRPFQRCLAVFYFVQNKELVILLYTFPVMNCPPDK